MSSDIIKVFIVELELSSIQLNKNVCSMLWHYMLTDIACYQGNSLDQKYFH